MKSEAQLKLLAVGAAAKLDKTAKTAEEINFDAYNAGRSATVTIDVIAEKQNYRVLIEPQTGKVKSVTPREKPWDIGGKVQK